MKQILARETNVSLHIELAPVDIGFLDLQNILLEQAPLIKVTVVPILLIK